MNKISAKIGYEYYAAMHRFSPVKDEDVEFAAKKTRVLRKPSDDRIESDINTVQNFLFGKGLTFPCRRFIYELPDVKSSAVALENAHMVISVYDDSKIMSAGIFFNVETDDPENIVYLRQIEMSDITFTMVDKEYSMKGLASVFIEALEGNPSEIEEAFLLEVNQYNEEDDIDVVFDKYALPLYGMMTGDEGYEYVGRKCAVERLSNYWSTRNFARAVAFNNNFMLVNLNRGENAKSYMEHQAKYGEDFYGGGNPYFNVDALTSGVCHGLFFTVETGMVAKTIGADVLSRQVEKVHIKNVASANDISKTKVLRKDLILTLKRLEQIDIAELGALERMVMEGLDIIPLVEKLKYLLELLESELNLLYDTNTNLIVNAIAIVGLFLAVLQIVLEFI